MTLFFRDRRFNLTRGGEFLTRLFFARRLAPDSVAGLFGAQREVIVHTLERHIANRGSPKTGFDVFDLALAFSESQLRSALEWMDASVGPGVLHRGAAETRPRGSRTSA